MHTSKLKYPFMAGILICLMAIVSCKGNSKKGEHIASTPEELQKKVIEIIRTSIESNLADSYLMGDSTLILKQSSISKLLYNKNNFTPLWNEGGQWIPASDSLYDFISKAQLYGLFPEDYHIKSLNEIRKKFINDSLNKKDRKDATLWAKADLLMSDAFVKILKDIKLGRLPDDSISLRKDSVLSNDFFIQQLESVKQIGLFNTVHKLEPDHPEYYLLKACIKKFLDSADYKDFTKLPYPIKDIQKFNQLLQTRLYEGGFISNDSTLADSTELATAVKKFQQKKGLAVDGKVGEATVRMLNVNDRENFIRIAISMDKYKLLPEKMPSKYIWVNTSANYLQVFENEKVKISSKVICGKPKTRTPLLNSFVSIIITYPQWVPPPSIVSKEILPAVKKNPGYLAKKGFSLVDAKGEEVDPYTVDWSKYSKGIPYRVVQGSGDANALGIIKFHFDNKYSVYLHDTNQRYLFANAMRSLSHGCVRVQEWQNLAYYMLRNDNVASTDKNNSRIDSVKAWLQKKQKRNISLKNKIPVYIRYVTCEGRDGKIVFYDDVYGEDRWLREKYFASK